MEKNQLQSHTKIGTRTSFFSYLRKWSDGITSIWVVINGQTLDTLVKWKNQKIKFQKSLSWDFFSLYLACFKNWPCNLYWFSPDYNVGIGLT